MTAALESAVARLLEVLPCPVPGGGERFVLRVACGSQDPDSWLSANERTHWSRRARVTRAWRSTTAALARDAGLPALQRAHVFAVLHHGDRRRRDPANSGPTVKAAVDGLVDAGVLPDDDDVHLVGPDVRLGAPTGWARSARVGPLPRAAITLVLTDLGPVPARTTS